MKMPVKIHPAANIFPMMSDAEYAGLLEDIRDNGQREDCLFWREQLIDGRNRYKACMELGIEPSECMLDDDQDPVSYVISANLHRRQLSTSQRAIVAARLATLGHGSNQHKEKEESQNCPSSLDYTAAALSVSKSSIKAAKKVIESKSNPLIEAVKNGSVTVSLAAKLINETDDKKEIASLVKEGTKAIREFVTPGNDYVDEQDGAANTKKFDADDRGDKLILWLRKELDSWPEGIRPMAFTFVNSVLLEYRK